MIKKIITLYLFSLMLLSIQSLPLYAQNNPETNANSQQVYVEVLPDIPLMKGLEELHDMRVVFDKPDGRIIEAFYYSGSLAQDDIDVFYAQTLPQLGWVLNESRVYTRNQEQLTIKVEQLYQDILVHFSLSPQKK